MNNNANQQTPATGPGQTIEPEYETKQELATRLGVSTRTINALMEQGLPYRRFTGKLLRFHRVSVDRWLASREIRRA
jgi:excisionase family DNA binding protein